MTYADKKKLILAVPKGRILEELMPLLKACDIIPEDDFTNDKRHTVIGFSSNLLIEMYYEGHDVYSIDKMYAHVFETRSENIQFLSLKDFRQLIKA